MSSRRAGFFLTLTVFALALGFAIAGCGGGGGDPAVIADTGPPVWVGAAGIRAVQTGDQMARVFFNQASDDDSPPVNFNVYYDTVTPVRFGAGAVKLTAVDKVQNAGGTGWLYDVTGLVNGTTYYFAVRAQDSAPAPNEDKNTVELAGMVGDVTPPYWPTLTGVRAVQPGHLSVTIYWNSAEDAVNDDITYNIYYDTQTPVRIGAEAVTLTEVDAVDAAPEEYDWKYLIGGLDCNQTYWFTVRARDSALPPNEEQNTVENVASPLDKEPPSWPGTEGAQYVVGGAEAAMVYWNEAEDADSPPVSYNIYYDTVSPIRFDSGAVRVEAEPDVSSSAYDLEYRLTGLTVGNTYFLAVRAQDSFMWPNEEENTIERQFSTTAYSSPEPPIYLNGTVSIIDQSQVILLWSASHTPDVVSYRVYRHMGSPGAFPPFEPIMLGDWDDITDEDTDPTNTTFVDGLQDGGIPGANGFTDFFYVVTAVDGNGKESSTAPQMPSLRPTGLVSYVLLVDNTGQLGAELDDSEDYEHRNALLDLGLDDGRHFETVTTSDYDLDQASEREQFEQDLALDSRMCVIWFTADAFEADVVSEYQIGLLKGYLDSGGKLILDGDDILYSMYQNAMDEFLEDYIGVDQSQWPYINDHGAADQTDLIGITGSIFANWSAHRGDPQGFEDSFVFDPSSGALEALAVNNWPAAGYELVATQHYDSQAGSYLFMMSIGLEDIESAAKRENWLLRIFNWMDVPLP